MDENKLNIETVDGHNELVVSFLSRMVSLSDEEKQTVLSCLPDTGKQTITQLYEALRSQGHRDLAEKVEPYLQQGCLGRSSITPSPRCSFGTKRLFSSWMKIL